MEPNNTDTRKEQLIPPPQPFPWLVFFNGEDKNKNQTFCSILDSTKTFTTSIPELETASLWTMQHGWCLLANKMENAIELVLWNPSNLKKIELPPLKHN